MRLDDPFDELVVSLGGFYRTWFVFVGLELGLLERLRAAGPEGLTATELAEQTGTEAELVRRWAWGADVHDLVELDGDRIVLFDDVAGVLLDADRPEYLGGQFLHAAIGSLDFASLPEVFRTGQPLGRAPGPLPGRDRAPDGPGRRRVLPGGAGGVAAARRRPTRMARWSSTSTAAAAGG